MESPFKFKGYKSVKRPVTGSIILCTSNLSTVVQPILQIMRFFVIIIKFTRVVERLQSLSSSHFCLSWSFRLDHGVLVPTCTPFHSSILLRPSGNRYHNLLNFNSLSLLLPSLVTHQSRELRGTGTVSPQPFK